MHLVSLAENRLIGGVHSFYDLFMVPLESLWIAKLRKHIISKATGRVLEVGAGTAINLPYYPMEQIDELVLSDAKADPGTLKRRVSGRFRERGHISTPSSSPQNRGRVHCSQAAVESLPFSPGQFDTVVATLLFCSVGNPEIALREVYRVLRPGGQFLFIEHVRPLDPYTAVLFDSLTPAWRRIASGCHLNRDTLRSIQGAGFTITEVHRPENGVFVGGVGRR